MPANFTKFIPIIHMLILNDKSNQRKHCIKYWNNDEATTSAYMSVHKICLP